MGKKRNGISNKLKGPKKWLKGNKAAKRIMQAQRDKAKAKMQAKARVKLQKAAHDSPTPHPRSSAPHTPVHCYEFNAGQASVSGCIQDVGSKGELAEVIQSVVCAAAVDWDSVTRWLSCRLRKCCNVDGAVVAAYLAGVLKVKNPAEWAGLIRKELREFVTTPVEVSRVAEETLQELTGHRSSACATDSVCHSDSSDSLDTGSRAESIRNGCDLFGDGRCDPQLSVGKQHENQRVDRLQEGDKNKNYRQKKKKRKHKLLVVEEADVIGT